MGAHIKKSIGEQYTLEEHLLLTGDMLFDWDLEWTPYVIVDDDDTGGHAKGGGKRKKQLAPL